MTYFSLDWKIQRGQRELNLHGRIFSLGSIPRGLTWQQKENDDWNSWNPIVNPLPFRVRSLDKACPLKAYKANPLSHTDSKTILSQWLQKWQGLSNYFTMVPFSSVKPIRAQLQSFLEEALAGKRSKRGLGCLPLFLSVTVFWLQPTLSLLTLSRRSCCWYSNLFCTALLEMQVLEWIFIMP